MIILFEIIRGWGKFFFFSLFCTVFLQTHHRTFLNEWMKKKNKKNSPQDDAKDCFLLFTSLFWIIFFIIKRKEEKVLLINKKIFFLFTSSFPLLFSCYKIPGILTKFLTILTKIFDHSINFFIINQYWLELWW